MHSYVLSCSSAADLTPELLHESNIHYIPFTIKLDGRDIVDNMGGDITPDVFYKKLSDGSQAVTRPITEAEYTEYFRQFLEDSRDIIHVSLSSVLSGCYNEAVKAAKKLREEYPNRNIEVIDSYSASSGYGMFMLMAAEKRDEGIGFYELTSWIEEHRLNISNTFYTTDLSYLVRGGRLSKTAAAFGHMFNLYPVMNMDHHGNFEIMERIKGRDKIEVRLAEIMKKEALNEADYSGPCFVCDSNREYGEMLADAVEQAFPQLKGRIKKFSFGCAIGTHVGPDAAALFFVGKKRIE